MRITYLIGSFAAGGKERQLLYLIKHLCKEHAIQLIIFSDDIFYTEILNLPIELAIIPRNEKYRLKTISKVYKELNKFKPDVIHTWDNISQCIALPFYFLKKVKVINASIQYGGQIRKSMVTRFIQKFAFATSDAIVANSKQGLVVENMQFSRKGEVMYNGIDINSSHSECTNIDEDLINSIKSFKHTAVMVGRFYPAKDYITFVRAAKLILQESSRIAFFCIGDGPGRPDAEKEAGNWRHKNIFFLGRRDDVFQLLPYFNIGVLLNNTDGHAEGISNAIMEYMFFGLPVIATNAGGTPEIVEDNVTGYLVSAFDEITVAEKIKHLFQSNESASSMGKRGREMIQEKFNIEKMLKSFQDLYSKVVHGG